MAVRGFGVSQPNITVAVDGAISRIKKSSRFSRCVTTTIQAPHVSYIYCPDSIGVERKFVTKSQAHEATVGFGMDSMISAIRESSWGPALEKAMIEAGRTNRRYS